MALHLMIYSINLYSQISWFRSNNKKNLQPVGGGTWLQAQQLRRLRQEDRKFRPASVTQWGPKQIRETLSQNINKKGWECSSVVNCPRGSIPSNKNKQRKQTPKFWACQPVHFPKGRKCNSLLGWRQSVVLKHNSTLRSTPAISPSRKVLRKASSLKEK